MARKLHRERARSISSRALLHLQDKIGPCGSLCVSNSHRFRHLENVLARLATAWLRYLTLAVVGIGATTTNQTLGGSARCAEKEVICNQLGLRHSFFGVLACCV